MSRPDFRVRDKACLFARFTLAEVGEIVGLPPGVMDYWIHRGFVPWSGTPSLISAVDLVCLATLKSLALLGWPPDRSYLVAHECNAVVFYYAILGCSGALEVVGSPNRVAGLKSEFEKDDKIAAELTGGPHRFRYLYRRDDWDYFAKVSDISSVVGESGSPTSSFLDLQDLATDLCSRIKRPLIHVELVPNCFDVRDRETWLSSPSAVVHRRGYEFS